MKKITYKEFLRRLRKTPRKWEFHRSAIRLKGCRKRHVHCPLQETGRTIPHIEMQIMGAADFDTGLSPVEASIRADLLKACGLKETKEGR